MKNLKHFRVGDAKNGKRYIRKTWVGVGAEADATIRCPNVSIKKATECNISI